MKELIINRIYEILKDYDQQRDRFYGVQCFVFEKMTGFDLDKNEGKKKFKQFSLLTPEVKTFVETLSDEDLIYIFERVCAGSAKQM